MGLEAVVGEIRAKGQKEAAVIREQTRKDVEYILSGSQEKASKIRSLQKNLSKSRSGISRARKSLPQTYW